VNDRDSPLITVQSGTLGAAQAFDGKLARTAGP
jgi:hypothetical protein